MRLELFDMLDEISALMEQNQNLYVEADDYVVDALKDLLGDERECIVDIGSRIKTSDSVREKVIRQKLYHNHHTGLEVLDYLHDLLGISIKVQFIKHEVQLFNKIKEIFDKQNYEGLYYNQKYPDILLNLSMRQPQPQKNGYDVYRMDGCVFYNGQKINFELQIKAMVYSFWSEVEHKVVYKNNHYNLNDEFMTAILASVRNTLAAVDKQLNIVYDEMNSETTEKNDHLDDISVRNAIAKTLNDIFISKIQESIGFSIDFRKVCDVLSGFLYNRTLASEEKMDSAIFFARMRSMIKEVVSKDINFEEPIEFSDDVVSDDRFTSTMSKAFLIFMNSDFEWYVFFKMLFELLPQSNSADFEFFINLYRNKFLSDEFIDNLDILYDEEEKHSVINDILGEVALAIVEIDDIVILHMDKCEEVAAIITRYSEVLLENKTEFKKFEQSKAFLLADIHKDVIQVFD